MPTHLLLTASATPDEARTRVSHFFAKNFLVKYDRVDIPESRIIPADHPDFWPRLEAGVAANRKVVAALLAELRDSGFHRLADLAEMRQGYESKVLHIITHLLDGFFGIDTCFYNLEEDAHGISDRLARTIREKPGEFRLVEAECGSDAGHQPDRLAMIRKFEVTPPES